MTEVIRDVASLRNLQRHWRLSGQSMGLVPTMGALHEGHLSLVRMARGFADATNRKVVVSIFVNPIQFDREDDLDAYPRTEEADLKACEEEGADLVFIPDVGEMYASDRSIAVTENSLSSTLCGAVRPGHFDGVCTVVLKLFLMTGCGIAVFGEKDFQQLAIIRRMIRDLNVPVDIIEHPTHREADGLAMSSRNTRLTPEQRADAPRLFRALGEAAYLLDPKAMLDHVRQEIEASELACIDYLELVDAETLQPVTSFKRKSILAVAVFYGEVRLIDHVSLPAF